jgi:hypothetical protein
MPNNITNLNRTSGYRFSDLRETSLLYQVRIALNTSNLSSWDICTQCDEYICEKTVANLMNGITKRPQLRTVQLIMRALGYRLTWTQI